MQLADRFPQLLWRRECVAALLDTVEALARRAAQGSAPPPLARAGISASANSGRATEHRETRAPAAAVLRDPFGESDPIAVLGLPVSLEPPTSVSELADVLADLTELACQWLLRASVGAPAETRIAFHSYVSRAAAAAAAATSLRGGAYAGLATGLYALSPSAPSGPPTVLSHGMLGRARTAAGALLNRGAGVTAESGISVTMAALSNAGVRVRWAGVGASLPSASAAASGVAVGGAAAGASTTAGAPKFGFAGAASTSALGGFLGTPWAQLPLSKLLALGTSPGGGAEGSVVGVAAEDDDAGSEANDDVGSVAGRSTALRTVRLPGELQASALEASVASGVDVLGLRPATGSALAAALFKLDGAGRKATTARTLYCTCSACVVTALSLRLCRR